MVFSMCIESDGNGGYKNYDPAANELTVTHPGIPDGPRFCQNQNKQFRFKMPSVEVTEV